MHNSVSISINYIGCHSCCVLISESSIESELAHITKYIHDIILLCYVKLVILIPKPTVLVTCTCNYKIKKSKLKFNLN